MKTSPKCIVILGFGKFDHPYETASFTLAKEFAKTQMVYYVEYPFTMKDVHRMKNTERYKIRRRAFRGENNGIIDTDNPNLKIIVVPPVLSIHFLPEGKIYRWFLTVNEKTIAKTIRNVLRAESVADFIFMNSWVFHYPTIADYIKPSRRIYHCVDPLIMPYDVKHGIISEKQLMQRSDVVICTSKQLYEEKRMLHPKTYFVPNGADVEHSLKAADPQLPEHTSMANFNKPIIGYFGNIEKRIDYEMLKEVAQNNPDKIFVFAGPVQKQWVPAYFFDIPNIRFVGRIPYAEMPNVVKSFAVAIIPFRRYENSATVFPIKLFEYLGAGKPVVSTDFNPDLQSFTGNLVAYCSTAKEFSDAISDAIDEDSESLRQERIELASQHTWQCRAKAIEELMETA